MGLTGQGEPQGPSSDNGAPNGGSPSPANDLRQALRDLERGEQTASAIEARLANLESELDAILALLDVSVDDDAGANVDGDGDGDGDEGLDEQEEEEPEQKNQDGPESDAQGSREKEKGVEGVGGE